MHEYSTACGGMPVQFSQGIVIQLLTRAMKANNEEPNWFHRDGHRRLKSHATRQKGVYATTKKCPNILFQDLHLWSKFQIYASPFTWYDCFLPRRTDAWYRPNSCKSGRFLRAHEMLSAPAHQNGSSHEPWHPGRHAKYSGRLEFLSPQFLRSGERRRELKTSTSPIPWHRTIRNACSAGDRPSQ